VPAPFRAANAPRCAQTSPATKCPAGGARCRTVHRRGRVERQPIGVRDLFKPWVRFATRARAAVQTSRLEVASTKFESNLTYMDTPISARAALLQALISGDGYGLELIDRVRERTKGRIRLHQGSIYRALDALEDEGFVKSYEGEPIPERGGRPRIYYRLTAEGRRAAFDQQGAVLGLFAPLTPQRAR